MIQRHLDFRQHSVPPNKFQSLGNPSPRDLSRLSELPSKGGLSLVNDPYQLGAGQNTSQRPAKKGANQNKSSLPELGLHRNLSTVDLANESIFQPGNQNKD